MRRMLNSITLVTRYLVDVILAHRALTVVSSLTAATPRQYRMQGPLGQPLVSPSLW